MKQSKPASILILLALGACGESGEPVSQQDTAQFATTAATESGEEIYDARCAVCHTIGVGDGHGVGPNLNGIMSREAGSAEGYTYSPAMQAAGFLWDGEKLDAYLENPNAQVPGTKMAMVGGLDAADRLAIIEYLEDGRR